MLKAFALVFLAQKWLRAWGFFLNQITSMAT
jgi:hypothetical protein